MDLGNAGLTRRRIMEFHARHKFLLMAHSQEGMRRLGNRLGRAGKSTPVNQLGEKYFTGFCEVMRHAPTRRNHTNVLQHLAGYFGDRLESADRAELAGVIDRYRRELLPLIVPITLIRHYVRKFGVKYLEDHIKLMFDLQVLAWQADITRVTTFMMAQELSGAVYPVSGIREAFHNLSHHSHVPANMDKLGVLNTYHVSTMRYLIDKLKATPDGDGTLLDHSMVLYGSGMGNSNQHDHENLPVILIGGVSGRLQGGRHLVFPPKTTMSNLLLAMLDKFGIRLEKFGDSTGMLEI